MDSFVEISAVMNPKLGHTLHTISAEDFFEMCYKTFYTFRLHSVDRRFGGTHHLHLQG
jgi:hypothetical protein